MLIITSKMLEDDNMMAEAQKTVDIIDKIIHESRMKQGSDIVPIIAYVLCRTSEAGVADSELLNINDIEIDDEIFGWFRSYVDRDLFRKMYEAIRGYEPEILGCAAFCHVGHGLTPMPIIALSQSILNIGVNEKVADFCCGSGMFLMQSALEQPQAHYYGADLRMESYLAAKARAELLGANVLGKSLDIEIQHRDIFSISPEVKFDKIFSNFPFAMKVDHNWYYEKLKYEHPNVFKSSISEWVFNSFVCDHLAEEGIGVTIVSAGRLNSVSEKNAREYFVKHGYIKTVVELPERLFGDTNIRTALIVFSHGNKTVRLVDATQCYTKIRRKNTLSNEDIKKIVEAAETDSEYGMTVTLDEMEETDYSFNMQRYVTVKGFEDYGKPLGNVSVVRRGAHCSAAELDALSSGEPTDILYISPACINYGRVLMPRAYLTGIDPKLEKYCVTGRALLISKNGIPFKTAVIETKKNQKILADGNFFIVQVDETKVDVYFLQAYLESPKGMDALKGTSIGATIPAISAKNLKDMLVPVPPMNIQKRIAMEFQEALDEAAVLEKKLGRAAERIHHVFDSGMEA